MPNGAEQSGATDPLPHRHMWDDRGNQVLRGLQPPPRTARWAEPPQAQVSGLQAEVDFAFS